MGKLDNKVAVITGGSSGIGFATARRFVDEGAFVYILRGGKRSWIKLSRRLAETSRRLRRREES